MKVLRPGLRGCLNLYRTSAASISPNCCFGPKERLRHWWLGTIAFNSWSVTFQGFAVSFSTCEVPLWGKVAAFGEGNGTPLQYSCLENPMDGGPWWAAVHGVAKSRTRLSDFTLTFHFDALEKEMATHSRVLAWRIPGTGEPGRLPSMGSHRVGHDWSDLAAAAAAFTPDPMWGWGQCYE